MSSGNTNGVCVFVHQLAQKDGTLNDPRNLRTGRDKLRIILVNRRGKDYNINPRRNIFSTLSDDNRDSLFF